MAKIEKAAPKKAANKLPATLPEGASGGDGTDHNGHYGLDGVSFDSQAGIMVGSASTAAAPADTPKSPAAPPKKGRHPEGDSRDKNQQNS